MLCLRNFLTGLLLFSVAAAYGGIAELDQYKDKHVRIRGFTGLADDEPEYALSLSSWLDTQCSLQGFVSHDWLTATYCYCHFPEEMTDWAGMAHYYQIEYYNFELNDTFILTSSCPNDYKEDDVNCVPRKGDEYELASPTIDHDICHTFPGREIHTDDERHHSNELCYKRQHKHHADYLEFDHDLRNIGHDGSQGPEWEDQKDADKVCKDLCMQKHHAALFKSKAYTPSHQVRWSEIEYVHF